MAETDPEPLILRQLLSAGFTGTHHHEQLSLTVYNPSLQTGQDQTGLGILSGNPSERFVETLLCLQMVLACVLGSPWGQ